MSDENRQLIDFQLKLIRMLKGAEHISDQEKVNTLNQLMTATTQQKVGIRKQTEMLYNELKDTLSGLDEIERHISQALTDIEKIGGQVK